MGSQFLSFTINQLSTYQAKIQNTLLSNRDLKLKIFAFKKQNLNQSIDCKMYHYAANQFMKPMLSYNPLQDVSKLSHVKM